MKTKSSHSYRSSALTKYLMFFYLIFTKVLRRRTLIPVLLGKPTQGRYLPACSRKSQDLGRTCLVPGMGCHQVGARQPAASGSILGASGWRVAGGRWQGGSSRKGGKSLRSGVGRTGSNPVPVRLFALATWQSGARAHHGGTGAPRTHCLLKEPHRCACSGLATQETWGTASLTEPCTQQASTVSVATLRRAWRGPTPPRLGDQNGRCPPSSQSPACGQCPWGRSVSPRPAAAVPRGGGPRGSPWGRAGRAFYKHQQE